MVLRPHLANSGQGHGFLNNKMIGLIKQLTVKTMTELSAIT